MWEKADANGDGVVTDQEMAMRERMVLLENRDKKEDQQRYLVWFSALTVTVFRREVKLKVWGVPKLLALGLVHDWGRGYSLAWGGWPVQIKKMKKTSMIINCARGGIIDEKALYQALVEKEIASAGLDVFDEEPYPADGKLLKLQNIILSPHIAGVTKESISRMGVQTVENALNVIDNNYDEEVIVNYKDINIK